MNLDVNRVLNSTDSQLVVKEVFDATGDDMNAMMGDATKVIEANKPGMAVRIQHQIILALVKTIAHLAKQNSMMDQDYGGRNG